MPENSERQPKPLIRLYGLDWPKRFKTQLEIEFEMIRCGGTKKIQGKTYGLGLFGHHRAAQSLLWPEDDHHRWSDLVLRTFCEERITVVTGPRDSGKAQPLDSVVMTPDGPRLMAQIYPGDVVIGSDGKPTRVLGVFPQGNKTVWEVEFSDGSTVECSRDHLWEVSSRAQKTLVMDTGKIAESLRKHRGVRDWKLAVKMVQPIEFPENDLKLDPYLMGALIGDGGLSQKALAFSNVDVQVLDRVRRSLPSGYRLVPWDREGKERVTWGITGQPNGGHKPNQVRLALEYYGLHGKKSCHKFIPHEYLYGSIEQRKALLQGLMDTDGWCSNPKVSKYTTIHYCTTSRILATQFKTLIESLGGFSRISSSVPKFRYKGVLKNGLRAYSCSVILPDPSFVFHLDRKRARTHVRARGVEGRFITAARKTRVRKPMQCIQVESEDGLYLTNDFILTHNTRTLSKWALVDYWCAPHETMTIMTSTGIRELELRVWGDIKSLFERATNRFPWLVGNINAANHAVFTDALDDRGDLRDWRKGLVCVPLMTGDGDWVGLDKFVGIKQKRRRLIADETQFVPINYVNTLDAFDKGDFKGGFLGNPIGGNGKALDKIAEPRAGWSSLGEITKTTTWRNKYGGVTINLVGTDSPNFDPETPNKYPYLIDQDDVDRVASRNGRDSAQFWTLILGIRKIGVDAYRVLTVEMCERCEAFNTAVWAGSPRTKIFAIDAGFGGDPCETMYVEFGEAVDGTQVIEFSATHEIQIEVSSTRTPEDQIAFAAKAACDALGVPDENVFFDAGMRATLPISMARVMSARVNAVNFGGPATDRPVNEDLFTVDLKTKERRLVKCVEQYSKFVTELWYSVRELVEAKQARGLPKNVAEEFAMREWRWVPGPLGQRYELETKLEYKQRMGGQSPNRADVASIAVEGARRLGFQIKNPKESQSDTSKSEIGFAEDVREWAQAIQERLLVHH